MGILKTYDLETNEARFNVTISKEKDSEYFIARYYGTTPKFAKIMNPGDELPIIKEVGEGSVKGMEIDDLLQKCITEIEKINGKVISINEE